MSTNILHVVPHLPPRVSGVGDFALLLGAAVDQLSGGALPSRYVAAGWDTEATIPVGVNLTGRCDSAALLDVVIAERPAAVLIHAVGYGYNRRGSPVWLVDAVRRLRRERPQIRVLTWFHELYAFGPPWRSSFWTSPLQRRVTTDLVRHSDAAFTNRHASADWLRRHAPDTSVEVCPTPSNVGEPMQVRAWADREPIAVVFGGAGQRRAVYASPGDALVQWLDCAGVEHVYDIGPDVEIPVVLAGRPVKALGTLSVEALGSLLGGSRVGVVHYDPAFMTKSGIVAAYLAHGVPVLTLSPDTRPAGAFMPPHARVLRDEPASVEPLSRQGHMWYQTTARSDLAAQRIVAEIAPYAGVSATGVSALPVP